MKQFFCVWVKSRDIDENWALHSRQLWYCDERYDNIESRLVVNVSKNVEDEIAKAKAILKLINEFKSSWNLNHL